MQRFFFYIKYTRKKLKCCISFIAIWLKEWQRKQSPWRILCCFSIKTGSGGSDCSSNSTIQTPIISQKRSLSSELVSNCLIQQSYLKQTSKKKFSFFLRNFLIVIEERSGKSKLNLHHQTLKKGSVSTIFQLWQILCDYSVVQLSKRRPFKCTQ